MEKTRTRFVLGFVIGILAMAVVSIGVVAGVYFSKKDIAHKTVSNETEDKIDRIEEIIDTYFLGEVDREALADGVYKGLLSGLDDPYSVYYTAEEYKTLMEETTGKYYGVGALVSQNVETGIITAVNVFEGAPADKAGMKDGDVLYKVEGKEVTGEDISNVVSKLKGEKGTEVDRKSVV